MSTDSFLDSHGIKYGDRSFIECLNCSLVLHNPTLQPDELDQIYRNYRDESIIKETPEEYFDRITNIPKSISKNFLKIKEIQKFLNLKNPNFRHNILDIGAGGGVFLYQWQSIFPNAKMYAIEPTPSFAELIKKKTSAKVFNRIYEKPLDNIQFDFITLNHVLEHMPNPKKIIENIYQNLKKSGYLYIEVPSTKDFTENLLDKTHSRFTAQHLFYFHKTFLEKMLEEASLTKIASWEELSETDGRHNLKTLYRK